MDVLRLPGLAKYDIEVGIVDLQIIGSDRARSPQLYVDDPHESVRCTYNQGLLEVVGNGIAALQHRAELVLEVPSKYSLGVNSAIVTAGNVVIQGLSARFIRVQSSLAPVTIRNTTLTGAANIDIERSDLEISDLNAGGNVRAKTNKGSMTIKDSSAPKWILTVGRQLNTENVAGTIEA